MPYCTYLFNFMYRVLVYFIFPINKYYSNGKTIRQ